MGSLQSIEQSIKLATQRHFASGADEDVCPGFIVQYIGDEASATIEVSSNDILVKHGDSGSEAADATIDSDGDTAGEIDVSETPANTAKKVEDIFNASPNWRCRMTGCLPDDATATLLVTRSATQVKVAAGLPLYIDGSAPKLMSWAITGCQFNSLVKEDGKSNTNGLVTDEACKNWLDYAEILNTFASDSSVFKVYECAHGDATGTLLFTADALTTATKQAHGATTPQDAFIKSAIGSRLVCRVENTTVALTINEFIIQGRVVDYSQAPRG